MMIPLQKKQRYSKQRGQGIVAMLGLASKSAYFGTRESFPISSKDLMRMDDEK
jgi:hypothetical protein